MRKYLCFAALAGASGVAAGAFGAHALKAILTEKSTASIWNTASYYQLIHAAALLGASLGGLSREGTALSVSWLARACVCWSLGIVLFSGSLYALALGGPRWLGPITPFGGVFLILGWICVLGEARQSGQSAKNN